MSFWTMAKISGVCIAIAAMITGLLIIPLGITGEFTINRPYLKEYQDAKAQLESCQIAKTPSCAPCSCIQGAAGISFAILGFIMFILSWISVMYGDLIKAKLKKSKHTESHK